MKTLHQVKKINARSEELALIRLCVQSVTSPTGNLCEGHTISLVSRSSFVFFAIQVDYFNQMSSFRKLPNGVIKDNQFRLERLDANTPTGADDLVLEL